MNAGVFCDSKEFHFLFFNIFIFNSIQMFMLLFLNGFWCIHLERIGYQKLLYVVLHIST